MGLTPSVPYTGNQSRMQIQGLSSNLVLAVCPDLPFRERKGLAVYLPPQKNAFFVPPVYKPLGALCLAALVLLNFKYGIGIKVNNLLYFVT